jgi:signal transduction histidine kinase/CheY-like chemotaxis protein
MVHMTEPGQPGPDERAGPDIGKQAGEDRQDARDAQELLDVEAGEERRDARDAQEQVDVQAGEDRRDARDAQEQQDVETGEERRDARNAQELLDVETGEERRDARDAQELLDVETGEERRDARDAYERFTVQRERWEALGRKERRHAQQQFDVRAGEERRDARDARDAREQQDVETGEERRDARDAQELLDVETGEERRDARDAQELLDVETGEERRDAQERFIVRRERREALGRKERMQAQLQQAQRLENLGQLAGGVAHDFNNLLAVILNYTTFVSETLTAANGSDWAEGRDAALGDLEQVKLAAERAARLTRQLLAFARREVIRPQVLDIDEVITAVEEMLRRTLGEHVELLTSLGADLWPVLADPGQLEQVLVNLAVNARDAMPGGGTLMIDTGNITVDADTIAGGSKARRGRNVRLRVSDSGTGMAAKVVEHAFEPFFTTKGEGAGTGLGLATVYGIIAQAGGSVRIYSEPGTGTTFTITLPVTTEVALPKAEPVPYQRSPRGETVLVVEDEVALREVTKRIFARNGYKVITAANGPEALDVASNYPGEIHLLVTDVVMPLMLGKEVAKRMRVIKPGIEVLFMSGYAQPVLASQGRLDPDVMLVEKPFSEAELMAKAGEVLNGHFGGFETVGGPGKLQDVVPGVRLGRDLALGRDTAQPARLEVLERLDQLVPGVHHERPVRRHRLTDRLPAEDQDVQLVAGSLLGPRGVHGQRVTRAEHRELPGPDRTVVRADRAGATQHVDQRVEVAAPGQVQLGAGLQGHVQQADGRVRDAGAGVPGQVARDDPDQRAAVRRRQQRYLLGPDVLVARGGHLEAPGQVDPQLEAVEQPAAHHQFLGGLLDVQDPAARGHPLGVAVGDQAAAAVGVLVAEHAVDDVRDGLEPAVRVPRRALGLTRRVLHLAHLVHVDERVQLPQLHAGERPADRETLTLEPGRRGGHRHDRPLSRDGGVGLGDAGQHQNVLNGHRWHDISSVKPSRPA